MRPLCSAYQSTFGSLGPMHVTTKQLRAAITERWLGAVLAGLLLLVVSTPTRAAGHLEDDTDHGLVVARSEDGRPLCWIDSRVYLDAAVYSQNEFQLHNGIELRRGRFAVTSRLAGGLTSQLDIDVADDEVEIEDAWIGLERASYGWRIGSFKEPFGLEHLVSSRYITFMERGLVDALVPGRSVGLAFWSHGDRWFASVGAFGQDVDDVDDQNDEAHAFTGRAVVLPVWGPGRLVHFGIAGTRRTPDARRPGADRVRYRTRPETHVSRNRILSTGFVDGVNHTTSLGLEAAHVWGPFSAQGEVIRTVIARERGNRDADLWGSYAYASWFLSGESRPYSRARGELGRLRPDESSGAWEIAGRYSWLDLNDADAGVFGGRAEAITLGANWYATANTRVLSSWTRVRTDRWASGAGRFALDRSQRFWFLQTRILTYL